MWMIFLLLKVDVVVFIFYDMRAYIMKESCNEWAISNSEKISVILSGVSSEVILIFQWVMIVVTLKTAVKNGSFNSDKDRIVFFVFDLIFVLWSISFVYSVIKYNCQTRSRFWEVFFTFLPLHIDRFRYRYLLVRFY